MAESTHLNVLAFQSLDARYDRFIKAEEAQALAEIILDARPETFLAGACEAVCIVRADAASTLLEQMQAVVETEHVAAVVPIPSQGPCPPFVNDSGWFTAWQEWRCIFFF